jgi:4-diphosphocytidyl-2-C-methyl-D-erythritol kinase
MRSIELLSPAKINLFLDVIGKRKDAYHDIATVFEKIDFCDRIEFTLLDGKPYLREPSQFNDGIEISSNRSELATDKDNLVYRACSLLKKKYGISRAVKIHIEKKIPIAAGLGGGSSNAATTLKGLNRLWNLNIKDSELSNLGKEIGADVPFFIFNHSFALGSARGDEISPIKSDLKMWHVVITPPARVLTKEIYERYDDTNLNLTDIRPDVRIIVRAIEKKDFGEIKKHLYNALEPVVSKKVTDISRAKDFIKKSGFDAVCVTGSGPAIFVLISKRKEAENLKDELVKSFVSSRFRNDWKIFVAKTLRSSEP